MDAEVAVATYGCAYPKIPKESGEDLANGLARRPEKGIENAAIVSPKGARAQSQQIT